MSLVSEEIADQPRAWARAADLARNADVLPAGDRVAVIGCGSSWHAAKSLAVLREANGGGETDAFAGSEAMLTRAYDRVVVISRSGATTEIRRALEDVPGATATVAVVGDPHSPIASICDEVVDLGFADDRAVVQTRFVTTVGCFFRTLLGLETGHLAGDADRALTESHPADPESLDGVTILGRGWRVGLADAGALMLRESAQVRADSYPSMEYRHGPIATAGAGSLVWFLDRPPGGLADEVEATGAKVLVGTLDPLAELIRIQRLAVATAEVRGLDVDHPPNLERAVVLEAVEPGGAL